MFRDYSLFAWVLPAYECTDLEHLIASVQGEVITPAEGKVMEIRDQRHPAEQ